MTQDQFYNWLENPSLMDAESIPQLREIIKQYPYFQAAQVMLAKNLKSINHIDQLNQLHLAAVMSPDRKLIHDYLHDKKNAAPVVIPMEEEVPVEVTLPLEETETEVVERAFSDELIPEPIIYQLETAELPELITEEVEEQVEEQSEPSELSFSQWLAYTESGNAEDEPKVKLQPNVTRNQPSQSDIQLIDHFLTAQADSPKKRAEFFNPQKVAAKSQEEDFTVVSETLAKIYAEQEKYALATQAYEALSLKYPEKSVYFAARLKELNDKQNSEN